MASSQSVTCGPCQKEQVNTKAEIWCYNCDKGFCSKCYGRHKKIKQNGDHNIIDIKSYKPSIGSTKTVCDKHTQQLKSYCPVHLIPCCDECISKKHAKCTGIKSLENAVAEAKIKQSKASVEKDITSILLILNKMANEKLRNIIKGEQQYKSMKESISKIREDINQHLDYLEIKLCKEANTIWSEEKSNLTDLITEIEEKKKELKEIQDDLHTVTVNSSKLQTFLGIHEIQQKVHQCQYAVDMENDELASEVDIMIKHNDEIENILSEFQSLQSFGEVKVVKTKTTMSGETCEIREIQVALQEQSNIKNMTMNIETKIEINRDEETSDMICLMDGRIVTVQKYEQVNLLTYDGKLQKRLPIPGGAYSVVQINQDTIAITYPKTKTIKIFNIENDIVIKVITLDKICWGVSCSKQTLAVGLRRSEIRIIDLEGNTLRSIQVKSESQLFYLVYCNGRVIYSESSINSSNAVSCVDESGQQIWKYDQDLSEPRGLCSDTYGNIIVGDFNSDRILVISKDGKESKVLLGREDGVENVKFICYKTSESYGLLCDYRTIALAKFSLSYK